MIHITGKGEMEKFAKEKFNVKSDEIFLLSQYIIENFHIGDIQTLKNECLKKAMVSEVTISEEMGCCVVPIELEKRLQTEANGEIAKEIASVASLVYLFENGVGVQIK